MISVEAAQAIISEKIMTHSLEEIPLGEASGRVLAQDVVADMDMPPFDRARMDGFALRAADATTVPARLRVIGEVAAGSSFTGTIASGEAVRIMTGAPLPVGADAVQKIEACETNESWVTIRQPVRVGENVTPRGSEARRGDVVLRSGTVIGPPEMAVLASFGCARVTVARRPVVGVISTGSELIPVDAVPSPAQIRDSNSFSIAAYVQLAGACPRRFGVVADDARITAEIISRALADVDVLVLTGGVSMGDYDLVKAGLGRLGATIFFEKVRVHPGKPTVFALLQGKPVFALPGNPVSVAVTFLLFVYPALRQMMGARDRFLPVVQARLLGDVRRAPDRRSYLPGRLTSESGEVRVQPLRWGGSSDFVAFVSANALIVVPEEVMTLSQGTICRTLLLPGTSWAVS